MSKKTSPPVNDITLPDYSSCKLPAEIATVSTCSVTTSPSATRLPLPSPSADQQKPKVTNSDALIHFIRSQKDTEFAYCPRKPVHLHL
jgi:hypothetical protein